MSETAVYRPHPEGPARAMLRAHAARGPWVGLRADRFEVVSRGDFVPGILYRPDTAPSRDVPLLLLLHGTGEEMQAETLGFAAGWVSQGLAVATIDLPLHGERSSPKLSERLVRGIGRLAAGPDLGAETRALVEEFARQATSDSIRTLDALCALPGLDADRVACMGIGVGAMTVAHVLAHDARPRAGILAFVGGVQRDDPLDPAAHLARTKQTSILIVSSDEASPDEKRAAQACFEAAADPKRQLRLKRPPDSLSNEGSGQVWRFLAGALDL